MVLPSQKKAKVEIVRRGRKRTRATFLFFIISAAAVLLNLLNPFSAFQPQPNDDPGVGKVEAISQNQKSHRRFVSYESSEWEIIWMENIGNWTRDPPMGDICGNILSKEQEPYLSQFLSETCTAKFPGNPWCMVDDAYIPYWYNVESMKFSLSRPLDAGPATDYVQRPVVPVRSVENDRVFSRLTYADDYNGGALYTEYIEPLVSHLRHPLAGCVKKDSFSGTFGRKEDRLMVFTRSYVLPRPDLFHFSPESRSFLFDAGASSWKTGAGGPSLSILDDLWSRHGINFDKIEAWEGATSEKDFYSSLPSVHKDRVWYHQAWISSDPNEHDPSKPFIPGVIRNSTTKDDYVFFKLDIDSKSVETGTVDYLLSGNNSDIEYIDEFAWEHHIRQNYIMAARGWCPSSCDYEKSSLDSYNYFLELRRRGVRAHSWV